ncbi:unnamed protein product, partial [Didymodactylos carnosus]
MNHDLDGLLEFLLYVGQAKRTFRTGWVLCGVEKVESVADHMYRMAVMSLLLPTVSEESKVRCMKLALVHDLSESVVGDLTEFDGVPKTEKRRRETEAMLYLTSLLSADVGREIFSLFNEYADQKTNEALLVKDLDIFDMLLQGASFYYSSFFKRILPYEYEKLQNDPLFLQNFFNSSAHNVKTQNVQRWLEQLMECRNSGKQFKLPSDSNLNTILKHVLYDEQGSFLYNLPANDLRNKTDRILDQRKQQQQQKDISSVDTTELLSNIVKDLPIELLEHLLFYVITLPSTNEAKDFLSLTSTCKKMLIFAKNEQIWKTIAIRRKSDAKMKENSTYFDYCKSVYWHRTLYPQDLISTISRFNDNYHCTIQKVELTPHKIRIYIDERGDTSLVQLQDPHRSTLFKSSTKDKSSDDDVALELIYYDFSIANPIKQYLDDVPFLFNKKYLPVNVPNHEIPDYDTTKVREILSRPV